MLGNICNNTDDMSPISSSNSFSSVDTNQTLLNSIANQNHLQQQQQHQKQQKQKQQQKQRSTSTSSNNTSSTTNNNKKTANKQRTASCSSNRSYRTKYGQFMIITPAVSIDRDYEHDDHNTNNTAIRSNGVAAASTATAADQDCDDSYFNNGNIFRNTLLQSSNDSGNSSDSSFRSNYNPYLHHSRQHLLPKAAPHFYTFSASSWRWCTLICAAMRCFGGGGGGGGHSSHAPYNTSFARRPTSYQRSSATHTHSSMPHRRLRPSSSFTAETAFEHFSAPFKPRKTRDHLNNITYEL